jgi:hypothetical protein
MIDSTFAPKVLSRLSLPSFLHSFPSFRPLVESLPFLVTSVRLLFHPYLVDLRLNNYHPPPLPRVRTK